MMDKPSSAPRAFDWGKAYTQLERALESAGQRSPEEVARILQERARLLARPRTEAARHAADTELLVFEVGRERYGVDTGCVVDVLRFVEPTQVPCTPPLFLGVINHRGRMLPVLDPRRLFDTQAEDAPTWRQIVTVEESEMHFGIAVDSVAGSIRVGAGDFSPPPPAPRGGAPLIRGVVGEAIAVLDVESIARDPRVLVNEEGR